ncbi:MAG: response regulator [Proteobacteria bacterium]|nr:response regulator [Pseudomonadota bacterium]
MKKSQVLVVDDEQSIVDSYRSILAPEPRRSEGEFHKTATSIFSKGDVIDAESRLEEDVYDVLDASNGEDAVGIVEDALTGDKPIALVFLDMRMPPGIDGKETARRIRERDSRVEIVIMTAYSDYSFSEIIDDVGTADRLLYFNKPFSTEQIEQLALSLTNRWHAEKELSTQKKVAIGPEKRGKDEGAAVALTTINDWLRYVASLDAAWKNQADRIYEEKLDLKNPDFLQYNQLRYHTQRYILGGLREVSKQSTAEQADYLDTMVPFNSTDDFALMMSHFFFIRNAEEMGSNSLKFFHDPFVQECFILSDLLKVRKTIEIIDWMRKRIESGKSFPSEIESSEEKIAVLMNCREVMKMTFVQCLKPEFQTQIYNEIDPDFITIASIEGRKTQGLEFCWNGVLKGERYRRIFLHLFFRTFLQTKIGGKLVDITYELMKFEQLKKEFFTDWLIKLGNNPIKKSMIRKLAREKKHLFEQMMDEEILKRLNAKEFDDLVAEINSRLPADLQSPVEPISLKHGTLKSVKDNLVKIKNAINKEAMVDKTVDNLSNVLRELSAKSQREVKSGANLLRPTPRSDLEPTEASPPTKYQLVMTDFVVRDSIRLLFILPTQFVDLYEPMIAEACSQAEIDSWRILSADRIDRALLSNASVILLFRMESARWDQKLEEAVADLVGVDIYDFHIDPAKVIDAYREGSPDPTPTDQLKTIKDRIDLMELDKYAEFVSEDPYRVLERDWTARNGNSVLNLLKRRVFNSFPVLINLIQWLVLEGMIDSGHLKSLTKALANLHRILVVFTGTEHLSFLMSRSPQMPNTWVVWGQKALRDFAERLADPSTVTVDTLIDKAISDDYEMVVVLDLANMTDQTFPLHIGIKELISSGKKSLRQRSFFLDLFHVLEDRLSLDRCNHMLRKYGYIASDSSVDVELFSDLAGSIRSLLQFDGSPAGIDDSEPQTAEEETNLEIVRNDLVGRMAQRIEFFRESYRQRQ